MARRWSKTRILRVFFATAFFLTIFCLYKALPSSEESSPDPWAPRVLLIFRDFGEDDLTDLGDSIRAVHAELPEMEVLVMSDKEELLQSHHLRFPNIRPLRLLRLHPRNFTPDFNPNLLSSADYLIFAPPFLHFSKRLFASVLDAFWKISSVSQGVGLLVLPLAGFPVSQCLTMERTGFSDDEEKRSEKRTVRIEALDKCGTRDECCICDALWSGQSGGSEVIVARGPTILKLPRPWISPVSLSLSIQLSLFHRAPVSLCPHGALSHSIKPPLTALPHSPSNRDLHIQRILSLFAAQLLRSHQSLPS